MPVKGEITINTFALNNNRVNLKTSLISGIPQTQEIIDYCAANKIYPQIQVIKAEQINEAWNKILNKKLVTGM